MDQLIDEIAAANLLDLSVGTLRVWRCTRRYPLRYVKVGRAVRYRMSDIESFLVSRTASGDGSKMTARKRAK